MTNMWELQWQKYARNPRKNQKKSHDDEQSQGEIKWKWTMTNWWGKEEEARRRDDKEKSKEK